MTYTDLVKHFKTCAAAAAALGEDRQVVHKWKSRGIPEVRQLEIQRATDGYLKADPKVVQKFRELLKAA